MLWLAFILIQGLFQKTNPQHERYIPASAKSVLKIDGAELIHLFVSEIILEKGSDGGFGKMSNRSDTNEPLGIDFRSSFYIYTIEVDGRLLMGILMNVTDEGQFISGMQSRKSEGVGFSVKNGVGLALIDLGEIPSNSSSLNSLASQLIAQKSNFDLTQLEAQKEKSKLTFWQKNYTSEGGSIILNDIRLALFMNQNKLEISGTAASKLKLDTSFPVLKREDLSIRLAVVPDALNELWKKYTTELGLPLPYFASISGNYHYIEPSGAAQPQFLPHLDGIYSFVDTLPIQVPLYILNAKGMISDVTKWSFKLGSKTLYYKQIDPKTIYLGQSKFDNYDLEKTTLFEVSGSLKQLLEIRNGGMMTRFLTLSSEFSATKQLFNNISDSHFSMKKKGTTMVSFDGKIIFNEGKSALNEFMQFLLDSGLNN